MNDENIRREKVATIISQRLGLYTSADAWGLEALKHVALIAAAGMTGTFALRAANSAAVIEKSATVIPTLAFAAGVICATLAMAVGYLQRSSAMEIYLLAEELVEEGKSDNARYKALQKRVSYLAPWVGGLGWLGLLANVFGGWMLFKAL